MYDVAKMRLVRWIDQKSTYVFKLCIANCGELATVIPRAHDLARGKCGFCGLVALMLFGVY